MINPTRKSLEALKDLSYAEFTVDHNTFYEELKEWRKHDQPSNPNKFQNCVYVLYSLKPVNHSFLW